MTPRRIAIWMAMISSVLGASVIIVLFLAADWGLLAVLTAIAALLVLSLFITIRRPGLRRRVRSAFSAPGAIHLTLKRVALVDRRLDRLERLVEAVSTQLEEAQSALGDGVRRDAEIQALLRENARAVVRLSAVIQEIASSSPETSALGIGKKSR